MLSIQLHRASSEDLEIIRAISIETFQETFSKVNTVEDMERYITENLSSDKLTKELENPNSEFFLVYCSSEPAGYLKLNYNESQTELKDPHSVEVERIYILKKFQGKKLGELLLSKGIEAANQRKAEFIWLGVWEKNFNAIGFYKRFGFVEFDKHLFVLGNDEQTDIMMKLHL